VTPFWMGPAPHEPVPGPRGIGGAVLFGDGTVLRLVGAQYYQIVRGFGAFSTGIRLLPWH
jgi:hypothetical protein